MGNNTNNIEFLGIRPITKEIKVLLNCSMITRCQLSQFIEELISFNKYSGDRTVLNLLVDKFERNDSTNLELINFLIGSIVASVVSRINIASLYGYAPGGSFFSGNETIGYSLTLDIKEITGFVLIGAVATAGTVNVYQKETFTPTFSFQIILGSAGATAGSKIQAVVVSGMTGTSGDDIIVQNIPQSIVQQMLDLGFVIPSNGNFYVQKDADIFCYP